MNTKIIAMLAGVFALAAPVAARADSVPITVAHNSIYLKIAIGSTQLLDVVAILDTGASHTSIPLNMAQQLIDSGSAMVIGYANVHLADGSIRRQPIIRIGEMWIGEHRLTGAIAVISPDGADLLLGFGELNRLGPITIDSAHGRLLFANMPAPLPTPTSKVHRLLSAQPAKPE
jgi:gag-polyprotein putative aspartyl protease